MGRFTDPSSERKRKEHTQKIIKALAEMLGAAEVDCLDDKSNVWRSLMINARDLLETQHENR